MSIWSFIKKKLKKTEVFCVNCEYYKNGVYRSIKNKVCTSPYNNANHNKTSVITGEKLSPEWLNECCFICRCDSHYYTNCGPKGAWFKQKQTVSKEEIPDSQVKT